MVLETVSLSPRHVEPVFERAIEQENRNAVDDEEPENPAPGQRLHGFDVREHEKRIGDRGRCKEQVPGEEIAGKPFQKGDGPRRKHEDGSNGESGARRPVSSLVPGAISEVVHEKLAPFNSTRRRPDPLVEAKIERRSAARTGFFRMTAGTGAGFTGRPYDAGAPASGSDRTGSDFCERRWAAP